MNRGEFQKVSGKCLWTSSLVVVLVLRVLLAESYGALVNSTSPIRASDFEQFFYPAGIRLNQSAPLYRKTVNDATPNGYVYSPLLALMLRPIAILPYEQAMRVWFAVNALSLVIGAVLIAVAARVSWETPIAFLLVLITGFRFWPSTSSLIIGQVNHVLLLLICAAVFAASRRRWGLAGGLVAMAALFKVWIAGFLLYMVFCRAYRGIVWAVVVYASALAILFSIVGWGQLMDFLSVTAAASSQPFIVSHSISGFARLHFSENGIVKPLLDNRWMYAGFVTFGYVALGLGVLKVALIPSNGSFVDMLRRMAFAIMSILLALPLCHSEYGVFALLAIWSLVLFNGSSRARLRWLITSALGLIAYLSMTRPHPFYFVITMRFSPGWQTLRVSACFFAFTCLWIALLFRLSELTSTSEAAGSGAVIST